MAFYLAGGPLDCRRYYAVRTKAAAELRAERELVNQGVEVFLPMAFVDSIVRGKTLQVKRPLLPRYLFTRLDLSEPWQFVLNTRGVSAMLGLSAARLEPLPVPEEQIQALRELDGVSFGTACPARVAEGVFIRILFGPYVEQTGPVVEDKGARVGVDLCFAGALRRFNLPRGCIALAS